MYFKSLAHEIKKILETKFLEHEIKTYNNRFFSKSKINSFRWVSCVYLTRIFITIYLEVYSSLRWLRDRKCMISYLSTVFIKLSGVVTIKCMSVWWFTVYKKRWLGNLLFEMARKTGNIEKHDNCWSYASDNYQRSASEREWKWNHTIYKFQRWIGIGLLEKG